jgi:hypothetical protein
MDLNNRRRKFIGVLPKDKFEHILVFVNTEIMIAWQSLQVSRMLAQ